jgi:hypothetical protein
MLNFTPKSYLILIFKNQHQSGKISKNINQKFKQFIELSNKQKLFLHVNDKINILIFHCTKKSSVTTHNHHTNDQQL